MSSSSACSRRLFMAAARTVTTLQAAGHRMLWTSSPIRKHASAPLRPEAVSWASLHRRTFASDGLDADALEKLPSLTAEEKDSLEEFFYEVCGADGEPPTLAELHALRILRINFHQMYGATATPNPKAIQSVYDHCMEALQSGKGIKAGDDTTASGTLSPAQSELEEWEDYHLTPEEQAEVEAVSKAPRKIQRAILEEELKASMRDIDPEYDGATEEEDEDRKRQERMFDMRTVSVQRTCKKNKGGGLFRFQAFVVVGNGDGIIGYGMGKAAEVVGAIDKAYQRAERNLYYVERFRNHTVYQVTEGKCTKTKVKIWPRPSGSGIRANDTLANLCSLAGIEDIRAKVHGSRHKVNMVKAFVQALEKQQTPHDIAKAKGLVAVEIPGAIC